MTIFSSEIRSQRQLVGASESKPRRLLLPRLPGAGQGMGRNVQSSESSSQSPLGHLICRPAFCVLLGPLIIPETIFSSTQKLGFIVFLKVRSAAVARAGVCVFKRTWSLRLRIHLDYLSLFLGSVEPQETTVCLSAGALTSAS